MFKVKYTGLLAKNETSETSAHIFERIQLTKISFIIYHQIQTCILSIQIFSTQQMSPTSFEFRKILKIHEKNCKFANIFLLFYRKIEQQLKIEKEYGHKAP